MTEQVELNAGDGSTSPGPLWLGLIPLLIAGGIYTHQFLRSPCVSRDGVVFMRFARKLDVAARAPEDAVLHVRDVIVYEDQHPLYPALIVAAHRLFFASTAWQNPELSWDQAGRVASI